MICVMSFLTRKELVAHCLARPNARAKFSRTREQGDTRVILLSYFALLCGRPNLSHYGNEMIGSIARVM